MSTSPHARNSEQPSTYIVQDRENQAELARLTLQDHLLTVSMGGVLAEQPDPASLRRVLDIGCGTGGWAIEAAQAYPSMLVIGTDISQRMIAYARQQAKDQQVADRVEFHVMDALLLLEFPSDFFDLVNLRLGGSFLRTWDWPKLLSEIRRVLRVNGVARITEQEILHENSVEVGTRINEMVLCAFYRAGYLFEQASTGLSAHLPGLLTRYGFQHVQTENHALEYRGGTPEGKAYSENLIAASRTLRPFLQKWGCLSDNYDELCQQMATDQGQDDFRSTWKFLTIWGTKPTD
jgi:SAM-dependent methyltransferase